MKKRLILLFSLIMFFIGNIQLISFEINITLLNEILVLIGSVCLGFILSKLKMRIKPIKYSNNESATKFFILTFIITFLFLFVLQFIFYPGNLIADVISQYKLGNGLEELNNWFPFIQIFTLKLTVMLFHNLSFSVFLYYLCFSFGLSFFYTELYKKGINKKILLVFLIITLINPNTFTNALIPDGNNLMCTCFLFISGYLIKLFENDDINLRQVLTISFLTCMIYLARRNALFLAISLFVIIILKLNKKFRIKYILCTLCLISTYYIVFSFVPYIKEYNVGGVETAGFLTNFYTTMAANHKEFKSDLLNNQYLHDHDNSIFFVNYDYEQIYLYKIDKNYYKEVFKLAVKNPKDTYITLMKILSYTYGIKEQYTRYIYVGNNDLGITTNYNKISEPIKHFYYNYAITLGLLNIILLVIILIKWNKKCIIAIPVILFNLSTSIFMQVYDSRYFFINFASLLAYILYICADTKKEKAKLKDNKKYALSVILLFVVSILLYILMYLIKE